MQVFISYGRTDAAKLAKELAEFLGQHGYQPWLDVGGGIPYGEPFPERIERGIATSQVLIALLSHSSIQPKSFCRLEILYAHAKGIPVLPVRIADVADTDLPILLIAINYVDAHVDPLGTFSALPPLIDAVATNICAVYKDWQETEGRSAWWCAGTELHFEEELGRHGGAYQGRQWLFAKLDQWVDDSSANRLLFITGDPGVGKSAFAAQLTARLNVRGVHFCSSTKAGSCGYAAWLKGLVYQLAAQLAPYRARVEGMREPNWGEAPDTLFRTLVADPLLDCQAEVDVAVPWVFVIDALDESLAVDGPGLSVLLAGFHTAIPLWLRVVVTSRPDEALVAMFSEEWIDRERLDAEGTENLEDLSIYVRERVARDLSEIVTAEEAPETTRRITELSAGNFLYARLTLDALGSARAEHRLSLDELGGLPADLGGLYVRMFRKRFADKDGQVREAYHREVRPLLDCLVAARGPIRPQELMAAAGIPYDTATAGMSALSQFLSRSDAGDSLFHRSVVDWLTTWEASRPFDASVLDGHRRLAEYYFRMFQCDPAAMSAYGKAHLATHLREAASWLEMSIVLGSPEIALLDRWLERGEGDEGLKCLLSLKRSATESNREYAAALAGQAARIYSLRSEYSRAEEELEFAIGHTTARHGRRTRAVALHETGSIRLYRGEFREAARAFRQALHLCTWYRPCFLDEAAANRIGLATIATLQYEWLAALRLARRALSEAQAADDHRHVIAARRVIGGALDDMGRYSEAIDELQCALTLAQGRGAMVEEARLLIIVGCFHYGQALLHGDSFADAASCFTRAVDLSERSHNHYCLLDARMRMAFCWLAAGESDRAASALTQLLAVRSPRQGLRAGCQVGLAVVAHQQGRAEDAELQYQDAVLWTQYMGYRGWLSQALVGLGAVQWHSGRKDEAQANWRRSLQVSGRASPRVRQITEANIGHCQGSPTAVPC